jgi:hypothetical protein
MYLEIANNATPSTTPSSLLDLILDHVDVPRRTPDGMVTILRVDHRVHGDGLRFTFRNGYSVHISLEYLWDYLEYDLKGLKGDLIPSLAACVARDGYHAHGGKKSFGVTFYEWMAVDKYRFLRDQFRR